MSTLITGATGFLGPYLMEAFPGAVGVSRSLGLDLLTDLGAVKSLMARASPDLIIHAAAMTNVNECEKKPHLAIGTNVLATRNIVQSMPVDCKLVYISTDMVYSGPDLLHREHSPSENPVNVYGMSKYLGEFEASKARNFLILRTNFYGHALSKRSSSLADFMVDKLKTKQPLTLFTNVLFSPLHVRTAARFIAQAASSNKLGIFNLGSHIGMSKCKFGLLLAQILDLPTHEVRPGLYDDEKVRRPLDTRMAVLLFERTFSLQLPAMADDMMNLRDDKWDA